MIFVMSKCGINVTTLEVYYIIVKINYSLSFGRCQRNSFVILKEFQEFWKVDFNNDVPYLIQNLWGSFIFELQTN